MIVLSPGHNASDSKVVVQRDLRPHDTRATVGRVKPPPGLQWHAAKLVRNVHPVDPIDPLGWAEAHVDVGIAQDANNRDDHGQHAVDLLEVGNGDQRQAVASRAASLLGLNVAIEPYNRLGNRTIDDWLAESYTPD